MGQEQSQNGLRDLDDDDEHFIVYDMQIQGEWKFKRVSKQNPELHNLDSYMSKEKVQI